MTNGPGIIATRRRQMSGRSSDGHRVATPLELFFDLAFVVAIAVAAKVLHHDIVEHHYSDGVLHFLMSFFAIWWAWMNFTWFASAYDTDDVPFRLLTMVQMCGVVVMAVGIGDEGDGFGGTQVVGYIIMRLALVLQWLRAAKEDPTRRATCLRYAGGITVAQIYWVAAVLAPTSLAGIGMIIGIALELSVPRFAERCGNTPWHPHHIAERYGLLTIIVLGEGVLGMTNALASSIHTLGWTTSLIIVAPASIAILLGIWWAYFLSPYGDALTNRPERSFRWGYGHFGIFASLAALGAGLEVAETALEHPEDVSSLVASLAIAIPLTVFLVVKYAIHNWLWERTRAYDVLVALALLVIAGVVGLGMLDTPVQYLIAAFVLVPIVLVAPIEYWARANYDADHV